MVAQHTMLIVAKGYCLDANLCCFCKNVTINDKCCCSLGDTQNADECKFFDKIDDKTISEHVVLLMAKLGSKI